MSERLFKYQKELDEITKIAYTKDQTKGHLQKLNELLIDAEQVWRFLDEKKKSKLSTIQLSIILPLAKKGEKISNAESEMRARASKEYSEFIDALEAAHKTYIEIKYKKDTLTNRIDALRTFISTEKEKMKIL